MSLTDREAETILWCPISGRRLRRKTEPESEDLNGMIVAGEASYLDGKPGLQPVTAGLVSEDGR